VDERFGLDGWKLRRLTDRAGILRKGDREKVEAVIERMSKRFPQLFVAVYTGSLGEVANIRQFGFWLLNRGAFEDVPIDRPNEAGILLTIDPETKAAGIFFGYLLDPYLEESDTFECLSRAHGHWLEERYVSGIIRVFSHLENILIKRSRHARRDPESYQRKVMGPSMLGDSVERMRAGHRDSKSKNRDTEVRP
jgi:uncharacterized membrane protein YgcG